MLLLPEVCASWQDEHLSSGQIITAVEIRNSWYQFYGMFGFRGLTLQRPWWHRPNHQNIWNDKV